VQIQGSEFSVWVQGSGLEAAASPLDCRSWVSSWKVGCAAVLFVLLRVPGSVFEILLRVQGSGLRD
jgi:hypothetical protein